MHLVFLGPPGSGKGTQATVLCTQNTLAHISTGDMLRTEIKKDSAIGKQVRERMAKGEFIEDELIARLVEARIRHKDCSQGFILDGVPRTLQQALDLKKHKVPIDCVVEFFCSSDILMKRLTSRRVHPASGRIYNLLFNPPRKENKDDISGEPLVQREDDKEETVLARIQDYHAKTDEVCHYYRQLAQKQDSLIYHRLDASLPAEKITRQLSQLIHSTQ